MEGSEDSAQHEYCSCAAQFLSDITVAGCHDEGMFASIVKLNDVICKFDGECEDVSLCLADTFRSGASMCSSGDNNELSQCLKRSHEDIPSMCDAVNDENLIDRLDVAEEWICAEREPSLCFGHNNLNLDMSLWSNMVSSNAAIGEAEYCQDMCLLRQCAFEDTPYDPDNLINGFAWNEEVNHMNLLLCPGDLFDICAATTTTTTAELAASEAAACRPIRQGIEPMHRWYHCYSTSRKKIPNFGSSM